MVNEPVDPIYNAYVIYNLRHRCLNGGEPAQRFRAAFEGDIGVMSALAETAARVVHAIDKHVDFEQYDYVFPYEHLDAGDGDLVDTVWKALCDKPHLAEDDINQLVASYLADHQIPTLAAQRPSRTAATGPSLG